MDNSSEPQLQSSVEQEETNQVEPQAQEKVEETPVPSFPPPLKSSVIPQPEEVAAYLKNILVGDPYNKFCVDCHHHLSTHACLTYGIFVCQNCAQLHSDVFGKLNERVKDVLNEQWDDLQLASVSPGFGGNRAFFSFLQEYNIHTLTIPQKYKNDAVLFYVRRLTAQLEEKPFNEKPPSKDWEERLSRAKTAITSLISRSEKSITENSKEFDKKIEEAKKEDLTDKITGFLKEKLTIKRKFSLFGSSEPKPEEKKEEVVASTEAVEKLESELKQEEGV